MQKITAFLWFDNNVDAALDYYTRIFKNAKVLSKTTYGEAGPGTPGSVMTANIELEGQVFTLLNGGPMYKFNEAVSFVIHCQSQDEVDYYWNELTKEGTPSACGWLKDKFGLSWQVVPDALIKLLSSPDPQKAQRVMKVMMGMSKIIISDLENA